MKSLHDAPMGLTDDDVGRGMPPGGGMVIAVALSFAVWATIAWEVLH
jgi:hypothetical protein